LGWAVALTFSFMFIGAPVGLGAALIAAGVIVCRASPCWPLVPAPMASATA
jgi:hypothetical protein